MYHSLLHMNRNNKKRDWILLVHQLPPKPTSLRVRTWRKLQKLGSIVIKNSVYVLPFDEKTFEDFQWLKQEIESAGGEASVFRAAAVEGATDDEIIAAFRKARDDEYAQVAAELEGLTASIRDEKRRGRLTARGPRGEEADLDRLHKELERIVSTDFFQAPRRAVAVAAYDRCRKALVTAQLRKGQPGVSNAAALAGSIDLGKFQGRRWITRKHLFIDRLASIWLIKRFIDKRPRFAFVGDGEAVEGGIAFDMYGAEFAHQGEDCSFETMIKRFGLSGDRALGEIAEIVHDIDLKDNKFNRLEAEGLGVIIRGLADLIKDDRKLVAHCDPIFDGLYELYRAKHSTVPRRTTPTPQKRARSEGSK